MWGLKGVAWQPPPALRNGRHTRHTHTPSSFSRPPSSFRHADRSVLPQPPSPPSLTLGQDTVPPRIIHISRGGKFLNFARIENFHILFPWLVAYLAALLADLLSLSGPRCDSCDRIEKFPKPRSYLPIHSIVRTGLVIERNAARRFSRSRSRLTARSLQEMRSGFVVTRARYRIAILRSVVKMFFHLGYWRSTRVDSSQCKNSLYSFQLCSKCLSCEKVHSTIVFLLF